MDNHHSSNNENIHIVDSDDCSEVNRSTNAQVSDRKELVRISTRYLYNRTKLRTDVQGLLNRAKEICIETDPITGTYIYFVAWNCPECYWKLTHGTENIYLFNLDLTYSFFFLFVSLLIKIVLFFVNGALYKIEEEKDDSTVWTKRKPSFATVFQDDWFEINQLRLVAEQQLAAAAVAAAPTTTVALPVVNNNYTLSTTTTTTTTTINNSTNANDANGTTATPTAAAPPPAQAAPPPNDVNNANGTIAAPPPAQTNAAAQPSTDAIAQMATELANGKAKLATSEADLEARKVINLTNDDTYDEARQDEDFWYRFISNAIYGDVFDSTISDCNKSTQKNK